MSEIHTVYVRLADSGLHVYLFDENGAGNEEAHVDATDIVETIESRDETDEIEIELGDSQ